MLRRTVAGLFALNLATAVQAAVREFHWDVTWVWGSPDGVDRPLVGINGQWPLPTVRVNTNDVVTVHLTNSLGNQTTGIHWHGINQISTGWMDGPEMVTQCPIPPGSTFTYSFVADVPGTYWYHSHNMGQYPDGMRGALIIEDQDDPLKALYDEEHLITLSDWYHAESIGLTRAMLSSSNPRGLPPFPQSAVVNDGQSTDYAFDPAKSYRFRIVNIGAFASFMVSLDSHDMTVVMQDTSSVDHQVVSQLRITPGQRYDVIVKGRPEDNRNYGFLFAMDQNPDWTQAAPLGWALNGTATLVVDPNGDRPVHSLDAFAPADDSQWHTADNEPILGAPDKRIVLDFGLCLDEFDIPRQCINGQSYIEQKVPTLYTVSSVGTANTDPAVYGPVNPFIVHFGDVVEIVLNNHENGAHPFHLHGHQFQVVARPQSNAGDWPGESATLFENPSRRDTVTVMGQSHLVIRFTANNPGVYLFHCHIEWHVSMGLTATIIEAPEMLRNLPIPKDHIDACKRSGKLFAGNAGGNVKNPFDTSNFNNETSDIYTGSTWIPPPEGPSCKAKKRRNLNRA